MAIDIDGLLRHGIALRYAFMQERLGCWKTSTMCRVLMVSKAGFYAWRKRPISAHGAREAKLRHHILEFHEASKKRYGSRPIMANLREIGERCGRKRVFRIMRPARLRGKRCRAFPVTTNSNHCKQIAENMLEQTFAPEVIAFPNRVWAGDITYIRTQERWLYLAVFARIRLRQWRGRCLRINPKFYEARGDR